MKELIETLGNYAIYVYPGIISLFIINFILARSTKIDNNKIIYVISFSYLYVFVYTRIKGVNIENFTQNDSFWILVISLIVPVGLNFIYRCFKTQVESILSILKIDTSLEDTAFDRMYGLRDVHVKRKGNMYVRIYSTKLPFKYEGVVESYESDPNKEMIICLTRYRISIKTDDGYTEYKDFSDKLDKYLYIKMKEAEIIEIEYI